MSDTETNFDVTLAGLTNSDLLDEFLAESKFVGHCTTWRIVALRTELLARMSA